jgi:hypothetical protein
MKKGNRVKLDCDTSLNCDLCIAFKIKWGYRNFYQKTNPPQKLSFSAHTYTRTTHVATVQALRSFVIFHAYCFRLICFKKRISINEVDVGVDITRAKSYDWIR